MSYGVHRASKTSVVSTQGDPMNTHAQADVAKQQLYSGFNRLPIGGEWRQGKMRALKDIDPYTDEVLLEIPQSDRGDLDDAYARGRARPDNLGGRSRQAREERSCTE